MYSKPKNPYACECDRKYGRCPCDENNSKRKAAAQAWEEGWAACEEYRGYFS